MMRSFRSTRLKEVVFFMFLLISVMRVRADDTEDSDCTVKVDQHQCEKDGADKPEYIGDLVNVCTLGAGFCSDYDFSREAIQCASLYNMSDCERDGGPGDCVKGSCIWSGNYCYADNGELLGFAIAMCIIGYGSSLIWGCVIKQKRKNSKKKDPKNFIRRRLAYLNNNPNVVTDEKEIKQNSIADGKVEEEEVEKQRFLVNYKRRIFNSVLAISWLCGDMAHYSTQLENLVLFNACVTWTLTTTCNAQIERERYGNDKTWLLALATTLFPMILKFLYNKMHLWHDLAKYQNEDNTKYNVVKVPSYTFVGIVYAGGLLGAVLSIGWVEEIMNPKCFLAGFVFWQMVNIVADVFCVSIVFFISWYLYVECAEEEKSWFVDFIATKIGAKPRVIQIVKARADLDPEEFVELGIESLGTGLSDAKLQGAGGSEIDISSISIEEKRSPEVAREFDGTEQE